MSIATAESALNPCGKNVNMFTPFNIVMSIYEDAK